MSSDSASTRAGLSAMANEKGKDRGLSPVRNLNWRWIDFDPANRSGNTERGLGAIGQFGKRRLFEDGQIRQHLAVDFDGKLL